MITLLLMRLYGNNQVSHAFSITQLPKHQRKTLIPTCEVFHVYVSIIHANKIIEVIPVVKCYQLSENVLVLIHMQTILVAKKISSPLALKISVTDYISTVSKGVSRFLVDSNDLKSKKLIYFTINKMLCIA